MAAPSPGLFDFKTPTISVDGFESNPAERVMRAPYLFENDQRTRASF
jgi:hypothetical protein